MTGIVLCLSWNFIAVIVCWIKEGDSKLFLLVMIYASLGILLSYLMWYRPLYRAMRSASRRARKEGEEGGRGRSSSGEATCLLIQTREQLRRPRPARRSSGHSSGEQQWLWTKANGCEQWLWTNGCEQ